MSTALQLAFRLAWRIAATDRRQSISVVITTTLACCGLAASGAVVDAMWLRTLPFQESNHLAVIFTLPPNAAAADRNPLRSQDFIELRERLAPSVVLAGISSRERSVRVQSEPEPFRVGHVSANLWSVLGVRPQLGRLFTPEEDERREPVVVLGHAAWQRAFGGAVGVLSRKVSIDGEPHVVIGVAPHEFDVPFSPADLWVPLGVSRSNMPLSTATYIIGVARLQEMTLKQADQAVAAAMTQLGDEHPESHRGWRAGAVSLREFQFGDQRRVVLMLFVGAVLLFLIAALNILNAMLASVLARSSQLRTAIALGAEVRHLVLQQTVLTLGLLCAGGIVGVGAAHAVLSLLSSLDPEWNRQYGTPVIEWWTYFVALALVSLTAALAGTIAIRHGLGHSLHGGGTRVIGQRGHARVRRALSAVQVSVVLVLMAAAIAVAIALHQSMQVAPGFQPENVLAVQLRMPGSLYSSNAARASALTQILDRVRAIPGVKSVASTTNAFQPGQAIATLVQVEGRPAPDGSPHIVQVRYISDDYFSTLSISRVSGRPIEDRDRPPAPMAAVVSRSLARQLWDSEDVIGKRLTRHAGDMPPFTVVGVAEDVSDVRVGQTPKGIL